MTRKARIHQPAKTAMQSGKGKSRVWRIEIEPQAGRTPDPLMGWMSGADTTHQIQLEFPTREAAVAYAERAGLDFEVVEPHARLYRPKSYAENFAYSRIRR